MSNNEQSQRVIVVTGGGTGMGKAIAAMFATSTSSADSIVIVGRREEVLAQTAANIQAQTDTAHVHWRRCDVSSADEVEAFTNWLLQEVGLTVDVLVNNAGGTGLIADDASLQEAAAYAHNLLTMNLVGTYLMTHALQPHLRRPGGRIINISSIAALRGGGGMYSAAKAGVLGLTYSLAGDLGPEGITVNAIALG